MSISSVQNFYKETLSIAAGSGIGKIYVTAAPTPTAGIVVISPSSTIKREILRYTNKGTDGSGDFIEVTEITDRGLGGTTAQSHAKDESIRMNITAQHWDELIAEFATKLGINDDGTLSGDLTFEGLSVFEQLVTFQENVAVDGNLILGSPLTIQDGVENDHALTKLQIQSLITGTTPIIAGIDNATITYDAQKRVSTITDNDFSITYTITWNTDDNVESFTDGTNTWTITYNSDKDITNIVMT